MFPVTFRVNRRARNYLLYVRRSAELSMTIPRHGSMKDAAEFLRKKGPWIERTWRRMESRLQAVKPCEFGTEVWCRGAKVVIRSEPDGDRMRVLLGTEFCGVARVDEDLRGIVECRLRQIADVELPLCVNILGAIHKSPVRRVTVRDQKSRWGSCSRRGTISLNWRLAHVPDEVRNYVIVHELMHFREMNHSPRFWAHVREACPDFEQHERWLKEHGRTMI